MVGLSVGQMHATGLSEPVEITFSHERQPPNVILTCVFWDMAKGDWDSHGCSTVPGDGRTVCRCDHLTFFALLLRPILDLATAQTLTRISQAGSAVSMIFLAFTMVLYVAFRFSLQRFKSEDAPKIHMALSISLFLLNLTFLINVGSSSQGPPASCWVRAAIFHYFLLCVFTWMGLEAFHLYLLAIRVFNTYFGHYFLKLSLLAWGLPVLVVIGAGSSNSYGVYTIRDQENRTSLEFPSGYPPPAGAGSRKSLLFMLLSTATSLLPSSSVLWYWLWWPGRSSLCPVSQRAKDRGRPGSRSSPCWASPVWWA
uniref:Adhesion G protein-coupled receptor G3 n=1 Tax=Mus musculus TaxID=10090 RepID=Q8CB00_MOUSE|nr:unnamed protein product [Mus musculus]